MQSRYPANVLQRASKDTIIALSKVTAWTTTMFRVYLDTKCQISPETIFEDKDLFVPRSVRSA